MDESTKNPLEDRVFDGLGFERYIFENPGIGAFACYKGEDGFFYRLHTNTGDETVIEYAENREDAEKNVFWDADWFSGSEVGRVKQIRKALLGYTNQ